MRKLEILLPRWMLYSESFSHTLVIDLEIFSVTLRDTVALFFFWYIPHIHCLSSIDIGVIHCDILLRIRYLSFWYDALFALHSQSASTICAQHYMEVSP